MRLLPWPDGRLRGDPLPLALGPAEPLEVGQEVGQAREIDLHEVLLEGVVRAADHDEGGRELVQLARQRAQLVRVRVRVRVRGRGRVRLTLTLTLTLTPNP